MILEGGISLTVGLDYKQDKKSKINDKFFSSKIATNFRDKDKKFYTYKYNQIKNNQILSGK